MSASGALYAETSGRGPTLVLLHGWALNLRVFDPLVAQLSPRLRLHALDLPGHGRSEGPLPASVDAVVERLLPQLPLRFHLLGWSLGGLLAMAVAAREPQRVASLTLAATTPRFTAGEGWAHGVAPSVLQKMAAQLAGDPQRTVQDMLELQVRGSQDAAAVLASLRQALLDHGTARSAELDAGLRLLGSADLRDAIGRIDAPSLVLAGQYDRVTHPDAGRWLARQLPRARFHEFARSGHAPFLSHAAKFAELVGNFVAETEADPHAGADVHAGAGQIAGGAAQ